MSVINVSVSGGGGGSTTATSGDTIDVAVGNLTLGTLPALQLAAGNGIAISYANGTSTISSNLTVPANLADLGDVSATSPSNGQALTWNGAQWGAANATVGTTLNGLSGAVTLVAGDGVLIDADQPNGNITISTASAETSVGIPTAPSATVGADGRTSFRWEAPAGYTGNYTLEIAEVGLTQNIAQNQTASLNADGSLTVNIAMDATVVYDIIVLAAPSGTTNYAEAFLETAEATNTTLSISGVYLPGNFTVAGDYDFVAVVADAGGETIGATDATTVTVSAHGSPRPPTITAVGVSNGTASIAVRSDQSPHELGFFSLADMTYYGESTTDMTGNSGWTRGPSLGSPNEDDVVTVSLTGSGPWLFRAVAENPIGEGPAGDAV